MTPLKLLVTPELERLARWLRLLGCDVETYRGAPQAIFPAAFRAARSILTCNHQITPSSLVRVLYLEPTTLGDQLKAAARALKLRPTGDRLFARCSECNTPLTMIPKAKVKDHVPPYVFDTQERFTQCPGCRRIYWTATHHDRAREFLVKLGLVRGGRTRRQRSRRRA